MMMMTTIYGEYHNEETSSIVVQLLLITSIDLPLLGFDHWSESVNSAAGRYLTYPVLSSSRVLDRFLYHHLFSHSVRFRFLILTVRAHGSCDVQITALPDFSGAINVTEGKHGLETEDTNDEDELVERLNRLNQP